ncbi:MAG: hypothetical protein ACLQPH_05705 [Acidimicrobiales bacterium]
MRGLTIRHGRRRRCGRALVGLVVGLATVFVGPMSVRASGAAATPSFVSTSTYLSGVSCWAPTGCMAVGSSTDAQGGGRALAERWNGHSWAVVPILSLGGTHSDDILWSVSCASSTRCSAVGSENGVPLAEQWDGAAWSLVRVPLPVRSRNASLNSVSCGGPADCTAVGNMLDNSGQPPETLIEHWDGLQWSVVSSPNVTGAAVSNLWAVSCVAGSGCTAVGDSAAGGADTETTLVEREVHSSWSIIPSPGVGGAGTSLQAIDCVTGSECTAGGFTYENGTNSFTATTLVEREVSGTWNVVPSPDPPDTTYDGFGGVACFTATRCLAAGSAASATSIDTLTESGVGSQWTIVPSPNEPGPLSAMGAISCASTRRCMSVGNYQPGNGTRLPLAEQWDGTSWVILTTPNP